MLGPLVDPRSGAEVPRSPVAAFARVGWTDDALWLGVVVHDAAPVAPFARDAVDPHVWGKSSGVELVLQPGDPGDNRDYYELQVDVGGAVFDSHFDDYNAPRTGTGAGTIFGHQDWASGVERAAYVARGRFYSVEVKLPWRALAAARVAGAAAAGRRLAAQPLQLPRRTARRARLVAAARPGQLPPRLALRPRALQRCAAR